MTDPRYRLSAADLADTGRWRLIIYISQKGISAYLMSVADTEIPAGKLFDIIWEADRATLLQNIENAVYDNPRVLDDYSADIIIDTDRIIWTRPAEDYTEAEDAFADLYHCDISDIFTHESDSLTALFTIAPGLKGFLDRTFPGTRISSHLSLLAAACRNIAGNETTLIADLTDSKADMLLYSGSKLLCGVSHTVFSPVDAAYIIFSMAEVYEINPSSVRVMCNCDDAAMAALAECVEPAVASLDRFPVPEIKTDSPMPLAAAFCAARGKSQSR